MVDQWMTKSILDAFFLLPLRILDITFAAICEKIQNCNWWVVI